MFRGYHWGVFIVKKDIPLSLNDDVIRAEFEARKYEVKGAIVRQKLWVNGQLTNCFNGDRVVYIRPPSQPLPQKVTFTNTFVARVFHPGQPQTILTCSKCLQTGHHVSTCTNDVRCRRCKQCGHMQNDCPASAPDLHNPMATAAEETRSDRDAGTRVPRDGKHDRHAQQWIKGRLIRDTALESTPLVLGEDWIHELGFSEDLNFKGIQEYWSMLENFTRVLALWLIPADSILQFAL